MSHDDKIGLTSLLIIAIASFAIGFFIRQRERKVGTWPKSSGVILKSELMRQTISYGRQIVTPQIQYEFIHEGQTITSTHWKFANYSIGDSLSAETITSRYPVGKSVSVFVNPKNPLKSVLEFNTSSFCWVPFGLGIFFLFIFALALLAITHQR